MRSCLPLLKAAGPSQHNIRSCANNTTDVESNMQILQRDRLRQVGAGVCEFLAIVVIYLLSELLIWGLSQVLKPAKLEFFSSVFGMLMVFAIMMAICIFIPRFSIIYEKHIKSKVR